MPTRSNLVRFLPAPENRAAFVALQDLLFSMTSPGDRSGPSLVYLHGPSGSGKSRLARMLADEATDCGVDVCVMSANACADSADWNAARRADLLIVEDLQHLPMRRAETLIELLDERTRCQAPTIVTALEGPGGLKHRGTPLPLRLTSRLAAGLVVGLEPLQVESRRRLLTALANEGGVNAAPEALDWLARHLIGGGRQLEGAVRQLRALQRLQTRPLTLNDIRGHFHTQIDAKAPTIARIAEQVSSYFHVKPAHVVSDRRAREVVVPRQVSMYLVRQLTQLSLQKIGSYFGGRDHKTVQHACRKIEADLKTDARLAATVRQLLASLS